MDYLGCKHIKEDYSLGPGRIRRRAIGIAF